MPGIVHLFAFRKLHDTDCRLKISQIVFVPNFMNFVVPRSATCAIAADAMQSHLLQASCIEIIICSDHAPVPNSQSLSGVEAKRRQFTERAHSLVLIGSWQSMSRILHDVEFVAVRQITQCRHITGLTSEVNRNHRPGTGSDPVLCIGGTYVHSTWIDIHKHWASSQVSHDFCSGGKSCGRQ